MGESLSEIAGFHTKKSNEQCGGGPLRDGCFAILVRKIYKMRDGSANLITLQEIFQNHDCTLSDSPMQWADLGQTQTGTGQRPDEAHLKFSMRMRTRTERHAISRANQNKSQVQWESEREKERYRQILSLRFSSQLQNWLDNGQCKNKTTASRKCKLRMWLFSDSMWVATASLCGVAPVVVALYLRNREVKSK